MKQKTTLQDVFYTLLDAHKHFTGAIATDEKQKQFTEVAKKVMKKRNKIEKSSMLINSIIEMYNVEDCESIEYIRKLVNTCMYF